MTRTASIDSRLRWNDTKIDLRAGARYRFAATTDLLDPWRDATVPCDPAVGHDKPWLRPFRPFLRAKSLPFYVLVGCLDRQIATAFAVLNFRETDFQPARDGRLWVFANDVPGFYFNNHGRLDLAVRTIS